MLMTVEAAMSLARENKSAPVSWDKYSFLHSLAGFYRRVPVEAGGRDWDPCGTPNSECRKVVLPCTTNGSDYCSCYCSCSCSCCQFPIFPADHCSCYCSCSCSCCQFPIFPAWAGNTGFEFSRSATPAEVPANPPWTVTIFLYADRHVTWDKLWHALVAHGPALSTRATLIPEKHAPGCKGSAALL